MTPQNASGEGKLLALAARCENSMLMAIGQHYRLPHGLARNAALRDAADYAAIAAALLTRAIPLNAKETEG